MYLITCQDKNGNQCQVCSGWPMFGEVTISGQKMVVVNIEYLNFNR